MFNASRDFPELSVACRTPNSCRTCGGGAFDCHTADNQSCGARLLAPEFHYFPNQIDTVPSSGGYFISYHLHCDGGTSGVLKSTSGSPLGPYAPLVHGVPGGDVSMVEDPTSQQVYTLSSGGAGITAVRLDNNMTKLGDRFLISSVCGATDCANSTIGFEGPYMVHINDTFFLSCSAFGNATQHGGPNSWYNSPTAPSDSHYSSFMGRSSSSYNNNNNNNGGVLGPFTNEHGEAGSWLAVDNGGHNNYFFSGGADGKWYATVWYGSEPNHDAPSGDAAFIDLPCITEVRVVDGKLVAVSEEEWK